MARLASPDIEVKLDISEVLNAGPTINGFRRTVSAGNLMDAFACVSVSPVTTEAAIELLALLAASGMGNQFVVFRGF